MKEEDWQEDMLMTIKKIDIALDRQIGRRMADWELSTSQTYLVLYILKNHEEGTYITDLSQRTWYFKIYNLTDFEKSPRKRVSGLSGRSGG